MSPLEGLKVVEWARILAGPWIGQTLADLGADVPQAARLDTPHRAAHHTDRGAADRTAQNLASGDGLSIL